MLKLVLDAGHSKHDTIGKRTPDHKTNGSLTINSYSHVKIILKIMKV